MAAAANIEEPTLPIPDFDIALLNTQWVPSRAHSPKLNAALYSMRCIFASMCVMHLHTTASKKVSDCELEVEAQYFQLLRSFRIKHPDAAVGNYIGFVSINKVVKMTGKKILKMGQRVRTVLNNDYAPLWNGLLDPNGEPPSGKNWEWVHDCVLVMLYRKMKRNTEPLAMNAGIRFKCKVV